MRPSWGGVLALTLVSLAPAAADAQTRSCDLVQQADFRQLVNARGEEVLYFRDPVRFRCTGGITVQSDSAVYNRTAGLFELVQNVVYRDSTRMLTSDWANYLGRQEQLLARGDVVLTDLVDGSVVRGQDLNYLRATADRPESRVVVVGGRPHATLRDAARAPAADTAPPVDIHADRMEILGETSFRAHGRVELERGAMTGAADSARFEQLDGSLTLRGSAWVQDESYRLEGDRIDALLAGDDLREVTADQRARLESRDLTVESNRLRILFLDGALDRLEAWMPDEPEAGRRALAIAEGFRLRADSIDVQADLGRLREVRAVHRAYGERRLDAAPAGPALVARDWIQGDTITGYFAEQPVPEDTVETVLERVVVVGLSEAALSLYRVEPDEPDGRPAINFMRARRIVLFLTDGQVARVEADGELEGVYLDPLPPRPAPPDGVAQGAGP